MECKNCKHYSAYYGISEDKLVTRNTGFCKHLNRTRGKHDECWEWKSVERSNPTKRRLLIEKIKMLNTLLSEIANELERDEENEPATIIVID